MQVKLSNIADGDRDDEFARIEYKADGRNHVIEIYDHWIRVWIDGERPVSCRMGHYVFRSAVERVQRVTEEAFENNLGND